MSESRSGTYRILLVGLGGIGSYLASLLSRAVKNNTMDLDITAADHDIVEPKNLLYQDYAAKDVGKNKASVAAAKYGFEKITEPITRKEQLEGYDLIILAVDNNQTRLLVKSSGAKFLDIRSTGTSFGIFTNDSKDYEEYTQTDDGTGGSCQYQHRLESRDIDYGNVMAAAVGAQYLRYMMEEKPTPAILFDLSGMLLRR